MVKLGDLMVKRAGTVDPLKNPDEIFDLYSIPAFDSGQPAVVPGSEIGSSKPLVAPNDVLLSRIVPHIRRAWIVGDHRGRRLIGSGEWMIFRSEQIHPGWLRHVFVGDRFHAQLMQTVAGVGGSLMRARPAHVATIEVPLPPLPEQRRIATILDHADALRAKRREALDHLDELAQSIFIEMFGDPGINPKAWPIMTMSEICGGRFRNGLSPSSSGEVRASVLTLSSVTGRGFDPDAQKVSTFNVIPPRDQAVGVHDLLICRGNGSLSLVGKGYFAPEAMPETTFPDTIIAARVDPDICGKSFVEQVWNSDTIRSQIEAAARTTNGTYKVNQTGLGAVRLPIPNRDLQEKFGRRVAALNVLRKGCRAALAELDALFASLQARAFRGEL